MYLLALSVSTLLLGFATSGILLGLFVFFSIRHAILNKTSFKIELPFLLPILLYVLFVLSLMWSVDKAQTLKGLERTVSLLLVPTAFMLIPKLTKKDFMIVMKVFTVFNFFLGVFFLIIATYGFFKTKTLDAYTYHNLVAIFDLNAIYVSLIFSISMFYLISLKQRSIKQKSMIVFFLLFLFLLSSKTILFVLCIGILIYILNSKIPKLNRKTVILVSIIGITIIGISSITLSERFSFEKHTKFSEVLEKEEFGKVYYWTGSSIRLFQLRILKEQIEEENIILKGFGLFASKQNLEQRHKNYDTYFKFHYYNYHNQYAQTLSETGVLGLVILLSILICVWIRGIKSKNFLIIMFSLMMSFVFFTESVLWRQRGLFLFIIFYCLLIKTSSQNKKINS
nr:O-antigen ligase family protein [uncultured Psychroserpens sp.]